MYSRVEMEAGHHGVISLTDVSSSVEGSTTSHLLSSLPPLSRTPCTLLKKPFNIKMKKKKSNKKILKIQKNETSNIAIRPPAANPILTLPGFWNCLLLHDTP